MYTAVLNIVCGTLFRWIDLNLKLIELYPPIIVHDHFWRILVVTLV